MKLKYEGQSDEYDTSCSYVGASQGLSITLGVNHVNVMGFDDGEMRMSIFKIQ